LIFICSTFYWSSSAVPFIDLHLQHLLLIFICSTLYWSSSAVPFIDLHLQHFLLIFICSTLYWSSYAVPFINLHLQYPLLIFICSTLYSCTILVLLKFSRQFLQKYLKIKLHKNLSSGSRVVPYGRTDGRRDRHHAANSRSLQFCECT